MTSGARPMAQMVKSQGARGMSSHGGDVIRRPDRRECRREAAHGRAYSEAENSPARFGQRSVTPARDAPQLMAAGLRSKKNVMTNDRASPSSRRQSRLVVPESVVA